MQYDDLYVVVPRGEGKFDYICNCFVKHGDGIRRCGHISRSRQGWAVHYTRKHREPGIDELRRTYRQSQAVQGDG